MKLNRTKLLTAFAALALPAMCFAEDATAADPTTTGGEAAEARKRAPAANFLPIVRGRLPLLFVHALRFDPVLLKMGNKDAASKFATSVGKVFDIRKGRNFTYVDANWKPTPEDIGAAEGWIGQVGQENAKGVAASGDTSTMKQVLEQYKERGMASAAEAAAQAAAKPKPIGATKAKSATSETQVVTKADVGSATADDLLG